MSDRPAADRETEATRRRYDRLSRTYDLMNAPGARRMSVWRRRLWEPVEGPHVLEVGIGTGRGIPHHPGGAQVTGIDLSEGMLRRARRRAARLGADVDLRLGDVQALEFDDATFDDVVASFVFCSVPDPVRGLVECRRVLKPGGRLHLLEHVRARGRVSGWLMDLVNRPVRAIGGANINRRTAEHVVRAGFAMTSDEPLALGGIVRLFCAAPARPAPLAGDPQPRAITRVTLALLDMSCAGSEARAIERDLAGQPGVLQAYVNPATERAYVDCEPHAVAGGDLAARIARFGYRAVVESIVAGERTD